MSQQARNNPEQFIDKTNAQEVLRLQHNSTYTGICKWCGAVTRNADDICVDCKHEIVEELGE